MLPCNNETYDGSDSYEVETIHLYQHISLSITLQRNPYADCSLHSLYLPLAISACMYLLHCSLGFHSTAIFCLSFSNCSFSWGIHYMKPGCHIFQILPLIYCSLCHSKKSVNMENESNNKDSAMIPL